MLCCSLYAVCLPSYFNKAFCHIYDVLNLLILCTVVGEVSIYLATFKVSGLCLCWSWFSIVLCTKKLQKLEIKHFYENEENMGNKIHLISGTPWTVLLVGLILLIFIENISTLVTVYQGLVALTLCIMFREV